MLKIDKAPNWADKPRRWQHCTIPLWDPLKLNMHDVTIKCYNEDWSTHFNWIILKACFHLVFSACTELAKYLKLINSICDMIKRNESDVGNIVFAILAKTVLKFLCFILFLALTNSS